jgi:small-conductance mechanosensitive channel
MQAGAAGSMSSTGVALWYAAIESRSPVRTVPEEFASSIASEVQVRPTVPDIPEYSTAPPRLWLWPNILSLDAPLIAVLWELLFAQCFRVRIDSASVAALGLGVWLLYVADRFLDGFRDDRVQTARHRFYRVNRFRILPWFGLGMLVTAWLSLTSIEPALIRNYIALAGVVAVYFAIVHLAPQRLRRHWPRELAVAVLFAAGTLTAVCTDAGSHPLRLLAPFVMFVAILWVNATGIECWERTAERSARLHLRPKITGLLGYHLATAAVLIALAAGLILAGWTRGPVMPLYAAIAISAVALATLELRIGGFRHRRCACSPTPPF